MRQRCERTTIKLEKKLTEASEEGRRKKNRERIRSKNSDKKLWVKVEGIKRDKEEFL